MKIKPLPLLRFVFLFLAFIIFFTQSTAPVFADGLDSDLEQQVLQVIRKHPEVILKSIQDYQQEQQENEKQNQLSLLQSITTDRWKLIDKSPILGRPNTANLLIEFSDFQCPYCADVHFTLNEFIAQHKDSISLVYKHYPLAQIHSEAIPAATASWAAKQQNKFWEYHDYLFSHQDQLSENLYKEAAKDLGLDLTRFESDRKSQNATLAIQKDIALAESLGISGTPFFIMNNELFSGAVDKQYLEDKLARM